MSAFKSISTEFGVVYNLPQNLSLYANYIEVWPRVTRRPAPARMRPSPTLAPSCPLCSGYLVQGAPRTFSLSTSVDF